MEEVAPNEIVYEEMQLQQEGDEVIEAMISKSRMSWADEVEAADELTKKASIWENFDITKITNVVFKLEFVSPAIHGNSPICEIDIEDISSEISYRKNVVVCYVLGAHPPFTVLNGYIYREYGGT